MKRILNLSLILAGLFGWTIALTWVLMIRTFEVIDETLYKLRGPRQ